MGAESLYHRLLKNRDPERAIRAKLGKICTKNMDNTTVKTWSKSRGRRGTDYKGLMTGRSRGLGKGTNEKEG